MAKLGYTLVQEWMYDLHLKSTETTCLAVIFGFSQDRVGTFHGSRRYLATRLCVKDLKTVDAALSKLVSLNLIEKIPVERNGVKFPEYKVTQYCFDLADSLGNGKIPQGEEIMDTHMGIKDRVHMEKSDTTLYQTIKRDVKPDRNAFNLAEALVRDLGIPEQVANDWAEIRRNAGIPETLTAYEGIKAEIELKCNTSLGITPEDCIRYAIHHGWKTFKAGYKWSQAPEINKHIEDI